MDYINALRKEIGSRKILLNCAGAVIEQDGKILLQKRSDNGLWGLVGGLLELDETYTEAMIREVKEETGLTVEPEAFLGIFHNHDMVWANGDKAHTLGAYFTVRIAGGTLRTDAESLELSWFSPDALPDLFAADHREAVKAFRSGVRLPLLSENNRPS